MAVLVCAASAATFLGACLRHSYEDILAVHLEVLSSMTAKAVETAAAGRRPTPNDVAELLYPLRRARQFARQYESRRERESYRDFVALLDLYEAFVTSIDGARADAERWAALAPRLAERQREIGAAMERTRRALAHET